MDKLSIDGERRVKLCNYVDVYKNDRITAALSFMAATATLAEVERFTLKNGDVLITKDSETPSDIAAAAIVEPSAAGNVCGYHLALLRPNLCQITGNFLFWALKAVDTLSQFRVRAQGITRFGLTTGAIQDVIIPVPTLLEQAAIAAFLDCETGKIDALVAEQERLIALLTEKRQAVISHAVTKGLNPNAPMKDSGVPWLGEVPAHWAVLPLARVTRSMCDGPFGSGLKSKHYVIEGARVIRLQNIRKTGFNGADAAFIDESYFNAQLSGHDVRANDVLIAGLGDERNTVGRACVAPDDLGPALVKADCFRFRVEQNRVSPEFLALQLTSGAEFDAGHLSSGSTRSRIPLSVMATRRVALPSLPEQQDIHMDLATKMRGLASLDEQATRAITLLRERRAALISAAVTGKIDVRDTVSAAQHAA